MGFFPDTPHDPLAAPHGGLASLTMPSAMVGPVVLAAPSDKRACASVAPPMPLASAQGLANDNSAARPDNAARADPDASPAPSCRPIPTAPRAQTLMPSTSAQPQASTSSVARAHSNARADPQDKDAAIGLSFSL